MNATKLITDKGDIIDMTEATGIGVYDNHAGSCGVWIKGGGPEYDDEWSYNLVCTSVAAAHVLYGRCLVMAGVSGPAVETIKR